MTRSFQPIKNIGEQMILIEKNNTDPAMKKMEARPKYHHAKITIAVGLVQGGCKLPSAM
jgi:hypothetical protein